MKRTNIFLKKHNLTPQLRETHRIMRTIKQKSPPNRLIPVILVAGIFTFIAIGSSYFHMNKEEFTDFNTLLSCESVPTPVFSVPEGIYDKPFKLEIIAPEGYTVFYTTNGSRPTIHSQRYNKPITINPHRNLNKKMLSIANSPVWRKPVGRQNHCIVVRARSFSENEGYSRVKNVIYSTPDIRKHGDFQVVHILIDPDSLLGQQRGIEVMGQKYYSIKERIAMDSIYGDARNVSVYNYPANYLGRGNGWTRPAEMILTNIDGKTIFGQSIRMRLHGNVTRYLPVKSYRIMPDTLVADSVMQHRFFDKLPYDTFKRLILRSSGQDQRLTMFRDAMLQQIIKPMGLDIQDYAPAALYINGNYWGIRNIREMNNENYLEIKYDAPLDSIDIVYVTGSSLFGDPQAAHDYNDIVDFIKKKSMAEASAYQYVCSQLDIDNFIDYIIAETFFANIDWGKGNARLYRIRQQTDEMKRQNVPSWKWRWLVFDLDQTMYTNPDIDYFEMKRSTIMGSLLFSLMENPGFREKFLSRYEFIIANIFSTQNVMCHINDFSARYQAEVERHISRWGAIELFIRWQREINKMKAFARQRPEIVLKHLSDLQ